MENNRRSFIKNFLKSIIYFILSLFNYHGAIILMYHSVAENNEFPTVKPADFKEQIEYLHEKKFNVIKLSALVGLINNRGKIPLKTVCLTFDDGYRDNFLNVLPELKKYGFPATIFVSTALIGERKELENGREFKYLNESDIKEMLKSGLVDFGSHSHNHVKLSSLANQRLEAELKTSKRILSSLTGGEIISLSYPIGRYNQETEIMAKSLYKIICTVEPGRVSENDNAWRLKRNSVDSQVSFSQFKGIVKFGRI